MKTGLSTVEITISTLDSCDFSDILFCLGSTVTFQNLCSLEVSQISGNLGTVFNLRDVYPPVPRSQIPDPRPPSAFYFEGSHDMTQNMKFQIFTVESREKSDYEGRSSLEVSQRNLKHTLYPKTYKLTTQYLSHGIKIEFLDTMWQDFFCGKANGFSQAALVGDLQSVMRFLERGIDVNVTDSVSCTSLIEFLVLLDYFSILLFSSNQ